MAQNSLTLLGPGAMSEKDGRPTGPTSLSNDPLGARTEGEG